MNYEVTKSSLAPLLKVYMDYDEEFKIENGSMVYHNGLIELKGKTNGGLIKSFAKSLVTGESMFITTAKASDNGAVLALSSSTLGGIKELNCGESQWILNDGVFLASTKNVNYEVKRVNKSLGKIFFGKAGGLFNMVTSGSGLVFISAFGSIEEIDIKSGDKFICDNYHAVAWEQSLTYKLKVASGTFGFTTGEGLVMEFSGEGKIFVQSKQVMGFAQSISKYIISGRK